MTQSDPGDVAGNQAELPGGEIRQNMGPLSQCLEGLCPGPALLQANAQSTLTWII